MKLDPRLFAYRPDLAEASLEGRIEAAAFTAGRPARITAPVADLRPEPRLGASLDSQLLHGETVTLFETSLAEDRLWAWVKNDRDGYVGYIPAETLAEGAPPRPATHRIVVPATFAYPEPALKTPAGPRLSYLSPVSAGESRNGFLATEAGWIYARHLAPLDERAPDYVESALAFLGVPYLWGGRSSLGLDCSALIQLVLAQAGLACPRDTDLQASGLEAAPLVWQGEGPYRPRRGDIAYMPRHVFILLDDSRVVHANAFDMRVSIDSLVAVLERVARESGRTVEKALDLVRRPQI